METFSYQIFNEHSFLALSPPKTLKIKELFEIDQPELYSNIYGRLSNRESTSLKNMNWTFVIKNLINIDIGFRKFDF